jgi:hypothetical protein
MASAEDGASTICRARRAHWHKRPLFSLIIAQVTFAAAGTASLAISFRISTTDRRAPDCRKLKLLAWIARMLWCDRLGEVD